MPIHEAGGLNFFKGPSKGIHGTMYFASGRELDSFIKLLAFHAPHKGAGPGLCAGVGSKC